MAPELFSNYKNTQSSEVWALGLILYEMCQLKQAFNEVLDIFKNEIEPINENYSKQIRDLVSDCLQIE